MSSQQLAANRAIDWTRAADLRSEGRSHSEIARTLGCSKGAIDSHFARLKRKAEAHRIARSFLSVKRSDRAAWFVEIMKQDVDESLQRLRLRDAPKANEDELLRERILELVNKRARLTYGLDAAGAKSVVVGISVKLGTNLTPQDIDVTPVAPPLVHQPAVDVTAIVQPPDTPPKTQ